jgi:glycerate kinase
VAGPTGTPIDVPWLRFTDGTAAVELAACCGLTLLPTPDPLGATTRPLGEAIDRVLRTAPRRLLVGLGGSASTDGGAGALQALGVRLLDRDGRELPPGGAALERLATVDASGMRPRPPGGVELLTDVDNPLTGPAGAAAVFAPQKGAGPSEVVRLDAALARLRTVVGLPETPGSGAAGGTAYGLSALWGAAIVSGAHQVLQVAGVTRWLHWADLVITGEGRFDAQSARGKLVGAVLDAAREQGVRAVVVAGQVAPDAPAGVAAVSLTDLAGSAAAAMAEPSHWLIAAGVHLARSLV